MDGHHIDLLVSTNPPTLEMHLLSDVLIFSANVHLVFYFTQWIQVIFWSQ